MQKSFESSEARSEKNPSSSPSGEHSLEQIRRENTRFTRGSFEEALLRLRGGAGEYWEPYLEEAKKAVKVFNESSDKKEFVINRMGNDSYELYLSCHSKFVSNKKKIILQKYLLKKNE